jgi:hypothetical protein
MIGAHLVLHLGLCGAMQNVPSGTTIPVQVRLVDDHGNKRVDTQLSFKHYANSNGEIEFDAPAGEYMLQLVSVPYRCSDADWLYVINEHNRVIDEQLADGMAQIPRPMLLDGTAPQSFLYLQPTYVVLDKGIQCGQPVPDPIPVKVRLENDEDSFYVWIDQPKELYDRGGAQIALQMQTPTGEAHFIRLKIPYPATWGGFPDNIQFNATVDEADWLSGQPTGVLLCPKLFRTSAG